jgi:hypothetical protein
MLVVENTTLPSELRPPARPGARRLTIGPTLPVSAGPGAMVFHPNINTPYDYEWN